MIHVSERLSMLGVLAMLITGGTAIAIEKEKKINADEGKTKDSGNHGIAYLKMSEELARLAAEREDAILMLAAARIQAMTPIETVSRDKTSKGSSAEDGQESEGEKADLYALAEQFSGSNNALLTLIENSKTPQGTKGALDLRGRHRPRIGEDIVRARGTDYYTIDFRGGALAEVAVMGDGDSDLDLFIYDENGNLVCRDIDSTDITLCQWRPVWTGSFRVEIQNLGGVYNRYSLVTN